MRLADSAAYSAMCAIWDQVPPEDVRENELSIREDFHIVSSYPVGGASRKVWVITEADRSSTCILLPEEY